LLLQLEAEPPGIEGDRLVHIAHEITHRCHVSSSRKP
jgi:hypothetical protein